MKPINVLSLFDGMSCGMIALERAGIPVNEYYASEIDKYATQVSESNYPNIIRLGDVTEVSGCLYDIDLLIGGSPCQGFSLAGKQLNFEDSRSKLFFEYVRILKEIRIINPSVKFLLENVKMKKEYQDIVSNLLGVEPIEINSALVSAQNRSRLYWTNIEGVTQPEDRQIVMADILEPVSDKCNCDITFSYLSKPEGRLTFTKSRKNLRTVFEKARCLTARGQNISNTGATNVYYSDSEIYKLSPIECERLQTVPDNYTAIVSNTQRYKMLGNGWTVDVIAHIFKNLKI